MLMNSGKEGRFMLYLGWIIASFLIGVMLTVAAVVFLKKRQTLRQRFDGLGTTLGRDYAEIAAAVKTAPWMTQTRPDGKTLRTWQEGNYAISLLFDHQDYCLGVMEERS